MKVLSLRKQSGFTIVELLVVIVIIGILAALTIVSYTGINQRAIISSLQSDLASSGTKLKLYYVDHGQYPSSIDTAGGSPTLCPTGSAPSPDTKYCLKASSGSTYSYSSSSPYSTYSLTETHVDTSYKITEGTGPVSVVPINITGCPSSDSGGYRTLTCTSNATLTVVVGGSVDIAVKGAGGGGGEGTDNGTDGGAGGVGGGLSSLYTGTTTYSAYGGGGGGGGGSDDGDGYAGGNGAGSGGGGGGSGGIMDYGGNETDGNGGGGGGTTPNGLTGVTGGGGSGGSGGSPIYIAFGGPGGAGGKVSGAISVTNGQTLTIVVGTGGSPGGNGGGGTNGVVTVRYPH